MYWIPSITSRPRCLIITEKVEFNIASEVNYIYILSGGQKPNKKAKKELLKKKTEACGGTVLPDTSTLIGQKLLENANIEKVN